MFSIICMFYSCDNQNSAAKKDEAKDKFIIAGEIHNTNDSTIVVAAITGQKILFDTLRLDSCYFNYKGVADSLSKVNIYYADNEYVTLFMQKKDSVYININAKRRSFENISGNELNELLYSAYVDSVKSNGEKAIREFILRNKDNGVSVALLTQTLDSFARPREVSALIDSISPLYKTEFIKNEIKNYSSVKNKITLGSKMPYLYLKGTDEKRHNVYDNRDYVTIVSFWASFDSISVAKVKSLKDISKKYKNRPLRFVNISVDDNDSIWRAKVKSLNLPGVNTRIQKGWNDELITKTGITTLPYNYIADTLLNIRKIDIYDKDLTDYLEKNVPKKIKNKEKDKKNTNKIK